MRTLECTDKALHWAWSTFLANSASSCFNSEPFGIGYGRSEYSRRNPTRLQKSCVQHPCVSVGRRRDTILAVVPHCCTLEYSGGLQMRYAIWPILIALQLTSWSNALGQVFHTQIDASVQSSFPNVSALGVGSVPSGDVGRPGQGFSSLGMTWKGECLTFNPITTTPSTENATTTMQIDVVDTIDKFTNITSISASAAMSVGIYSGDAAASYFRRIIGDSFSNYVVGKVSVVTPATQIAPTGLNALGSAALSAGPDLFHRTCGDLFATSAVYGGEFVFILRVESRDNAEYEEIKSELRGSIGNFGSGTGAFSQSMARISKKRAISATIIRNGLRESLPILTPDAIEAYARDFPAKITANNGLHMQVVRFGTRDYATVAVGAPTFSSQKTFASDVAKRFLLAQRSAGEVEYWLAKPDEFFRVASDVKIMALKDAANRSMTRLEDALVRCAEKPGSDCALPDNLPVLSSQDVPKRLVWVKLRVLDANRVVLGVVPPNETRRIRFRGMWSPSGGMSSGWWHPARECCYRVHIVGVDGQERDFGSLVPGVANAGERVEVKLDDNPYHDNATHPDDPAAAALY